MPACLSEGSSSGGGDGPGQGQGRVDVDSSMRAYQAQEKSFAALYDVARRNPRIRYHGGIGQRALANAFRGAAFLAYPSTYIESYCIVAQEALAAGLKVISNDLGALPETTMGYADLLPVRGGTISRDDHIVGFTALLEKNEADFQRDPFAWAEERFAQLEAVNRQSTWSHRAAQWGNVPGPVCDCAARTPLTSRLSGSAQANPLVLPPGKPIDTPQMNRKQRRVERKSATPTASHAGSDPMALHEEGIKAFRAGDHTRAVELIGRAIALNGLAPGFHYNLGVVLREQGRLKDAAASYERAIALKPDYANAHNNLGNAWKALGQLDKARASFANALQYNPGNADTHYNLGILCCDLGESDQAELHFRRCLECDPNDSRGVAILLAHLGLADAPERTSPAQLLSLYDVRSRSWDRESSYYGASLVAQGLRRHADHNRLTMLDIGCGTGLVGVLVRDLASRLDGVDISPAMLEKAETKGVYNRLIEADLASFMAQQIDSYDAILGAATLIHFGDLKALLGIVSECLHAKGLFVFTLFYHEDGASHSDTEVDYAVASHHRLARSGCFKHSASYVERLARQAEFCVLELEKIIHEQDQDSNPVAGILAVLQRS